MMGKFANATALTLVSFAILLGAHAVAQTTAPATEPPASQPPAAATPAETDTAQPVPAETAPVGTAPGAQSPATPPSPGDQEPADEESTSRPKKPHDYKNWNFNIGLGGALNSGTTRTYVRQGGYVASAGVARNANKYLGLRGDFFFSNLPLRDSTLRLAQASGDTSYELAFTLDPIINIPVTKLFGGYVLFGPGYYHRSGALNSDTAVPGSSCNGFFTWWGACSSVSLPLSGDFVNASQNEFGYNFGAGITRKMPSGVEIYAEYRLTHGSGSGIHTDVRPVTIGVRW